MWIGAGYAASLSSALNRERKPASSCQARTTSANVAGRDARSMATRSPRPSASSSLRTVHIRGASLEQQLLERLLVLRGELGRHLLFHLHHVRQQFAVAVQLPQFIHL